MILFVRETFQEPSVSGNLGRRTFPGTLVGHAFWTRPEDSPERFLEPFREVFWSYPEGSVEMEEGGQKRQTQFRHDFGFLGIFMGSMFK